VAPLIKIIADQLAPAYPHADEQRQVAWWLLEKLAEKSEATLIAHPALELTEAQETTLAAWINDHVNNHKPLQYILGDVPFADLTIIVEPPLIIPRPETEELCLMLIKQLRALPEKKIRVLDLCTGTGCIALSIAKALPEAHVYGVDISPQAIALAQRNATHNKISNATFILSDLYTSIDPSLRFDCIVSNPPYISSKEWSALDPMVTEWEDKRGLVAEHNGLAIIEKIVAHAELWLTDNQQMYLAHVPQLLLEIGYRQGGTVKEIMQKNLFKKIHICKDLEGKDRIITGRIAKHVAPQTDSH
jgi:release factor glutamine methyltransferase